MCVCCKPDILGCIKTINGNNKEIKAVLIEKKLQIRKNSDLFKQGELIDEFKIEYCPKCGEKL